MMQHSFFQMDMSKRLALELLQKVNNPSHMFSDLEADEDGVSYNRHFLLLTLYFVPEALRYSKSTM